MRLDDHLLVETPSNPRLSCWGPPACQLQLCSQSLEYSQGASCLCRDSGVPSRPLVAAAVGSGRLPQRIPSVWTYCLIQKQRWWDRLRDEVKWATWTSLAQDEPTQSFVVAFRNVMANDRTCNSCQNSPEVSTLLGVSWQFLFTTGFYARL